MSSSLRELSLDETLSHAKQKIKALGITRVTDTTCLDKIGIPVYASIRPDGNSLCVNAGKGFTDKEAKVGAYMEAIEYAYAEPNNTNVSHFLIKIEDLIDQLPSDVAIEDFGFKFGKMASTDDDIEVCKCVNLIDKSTILLPAQLVYVPFYENKGVDLFGTSTNGLASGNSEKEAMIHAVCELLERDVSSFDSIKDSSMLVNLDNASGKILEIKNKIEAASLKLILRTTINEFGFPFFDAFIIDDFDSEYLAIAKGQGLHLNSEIAAIRAIAEAAQSRLTHIHGGRDDIIQGFELYESLSEEEKMNIYTTTKAKILKKETTIDLDQIPEFKTDDSSVDDVWDLIVDRLEQRGFKHIFYSVLSHSEDVLKVVKVIIPKLEFFEHQLKKMGPRLFNFMLASP